MKLRIIYRKLNENKEFRDYVIWGIASAILNIALFQLLFLLDVPYKTANLLTLICVRVFVYVTNKLLVFKTKCETLHELANEIAKFFLSRIITLVMDYYGLIFLVEIVRINSLVGKVVMAVIVIITNYVFSKLFVFKKKRKGERL